MTAVRRSARARHQATSIYDDAKEEIEKREALPPKRARKDEDSEDDEDMSKNSSDAETEAESIGEEQHVGEDSSGESSGDEEDFKPKGDPRSSSGEKKKKLPASTRTQQKVQVQVGRRPAASGTTTSRIATGSQTRRGVLTALAALGRKALAESETVDNSLVAALLQSYKDSDSNASKQRRAHNEDSTIYTLQLEKIARRVIDEHKKDSNRAQTSLLNLLFRSVGGSVETNLDPNKTPLEDMDNEVWAKVVTDLVDEMRHTQPDRILLCADPDGAVHANAVAANKESDTADVGPSSLGVREYRKIYEEFWYVLGTVALTEGISSNDDGDSDDDSVDRNRRNTMSFTSTSRFDAEVVRELISRVTELVTVGQPDVRAAATIAALQLGHAVLNRTVELRGKLDVATRQFDAASGGKKGELSRKAESFRNQMDSLKRTIADLEEVVLSSIVQGVFMHRYRDSNMFIRAACLKSLSRMTLQRPDMFLMDKYLKYFGWMASDKAACVRIASLAGLYAPFEANRAGSKARKAPIDLQKMENVLNKFLPRIADCVVDRSLEAQEIAMALLLSLEREHFIDETEDENLWNQINLRALAPDTTPRARRDALYFVMDQLEAFDDDTDGDQKSSQKRGWSQDKNASLGQSSERMIVQRLVALASWVGHQLSDGAVPIDKMRVYLADYVVHSLRDMPEHKSLVTNWAAMLRAIGDDSFATTAHGGKAEDRVDVAKQRVLVQMLACAAQAEVGAVAESDFITSDVDPDAAAQNEATAVAAKTKKAKGASGGMPHERLSVALLTSLPDIFVKFKGDNTVLGSITILPRYILPSVFILPQRKSDFMALVKNLCDTYLDSSDEAVLQNTALSLVFLSKGDHMRAADARIRLQRMTASLCERAMELLAKEASKKAGTKKRKSPNVDGKSSKRRRKSRDSVSSEGSASTEVSDDNDDDAESRDVECAINLCLRRLRVLSKRCNLVELLKDNMSDGHSIVDELCDAIVVGMEKRLKEREIIVETTMDDEDPKIVVPEVWRSGDQSVHQAVAFSVKESLSMLVSIAAWKLRMAQDEDGILVKEDENLMPEEELDLSDADVHGVLRQRDQLITLAVLCFEQFLPETSHEEAESIYSKELVAFADSVQNDAAQTTGDLRSLFQKEWADAASPFLRACALSDDSHLIGGLVRYFRSKEEELQDPVDGQENAMLTRDLLLPPARSIASNWKLSNRREAGVVLAHVTGTGEESGKIVSSLSRVLKRIDPVRLLEAHMASLRLSYEDWVHNEPEELESERPTDDEMTAFAEAERAHNAMFHAIEQQASRLSMSLGAGKLSDAKLTPSLLGFVREGVKFAFSNDDGGDGTFGLLLGTRLSFLFILSRYAGWIRRNKEQREVIRHDLDERESALRDHPDFGEVHEDDLAAIAAFRHALGIKESTQQTISPRSVADASRQSMADDLSQEGKGSATPSPSADVSSSSRRRQMQGNSIGSVRSMMSSTQNSLSPLYEEDAAGNESSGDEESPPPQKRRSTRNRSFGSSLSVSTTGLTQATIEEGSGESESSD